MIKLMVVVLVLMVARSEGGGCHVRFSHSADRLLAVDLDAALVVGPIFIFVDVDIGLQVRRVDYFLDTCTSAICNRALPPFDFDCNGSIALPFDSCCLGNGVHVLTTVATCANGTQIIVKSTFTVNNVVCAAVSTGLLGIDLTVSAVTPVFRLLNGLLFVDLHISILNQGTIPCQPFILAAVALQVGNLLGVNAGVLIGGNLTHLALVPAIAPGATVVIEVSLPCVAFLKVVALADLTLANVELDLSNNGRCITVNCGLLNIILGKVVPALLFDVGVTVDDLVCNLENVVEDLLHGDLSGTLQDVGETINGLLGDLTGTLNDVVHNLNLGPSLPLKKKF